jgi:hypothetical protein
MSLANVHRILAVLEEKKVVVYCNSSDVCEPIAEKIRALELLLHPQLRNSRFDFNARYIRFDEAKQIPEFQAITIALKEPKNFVPYKVGNFVFYRRGSGSIWLYVVPECDFRVPRERKGHKVMVADKKTEA